MRIPRILPMAAIVATAAAALTLAGCSKETQSGDGNGPAEVRFTAGFTGDGAATRTTDSGDTRVTADGAATRTTGGGDTWVAGDGIGIYMLTGHGAIPGGVVAGAANIRYDVTDASTGALSPADGSTTPIEYPAVGTVDFAAYYPYGAPNAAGQLAVDLTDQSDPAAIDVLTARSTGRSAAAGGAIHLQFAHALSKVTLHVRAGTDVAPTDAAAISDVKLSGTPGSVSVDVDGGAVTDGPNAAVPLVKAATAEAGYAATFTAIVAPGGGSGRYVTLAFDGGSVVWPIPADTFVAGRNYTYTGEITAEDVVYPANGRITWDGTGYALTTDPTDAGLYFKFGGVTGIYSGNGANQTLPGTNTDPFDPGDVAWSPVGTISGTGVPGWATVPSYTAADFALSPNTVTPPVYHNAANVKAGKGDPCRLVGIDLAHIKATPAASLTDDDIDNGLWRLPTNAENQAFSGQTVNVSYTAHWTAQSGVPGGMFPDADSGSAATFLPAAGGRNYNNGTVITQRIEGLYWSSMPVSSSNAFDLSFDMNIIHPLRSNNYYIYGFSVRCVRQ